MLHYQRNALPPNTQEQQPDQLAADIAKRRKVGHSSNETDVIMEKVMIRPLPIRGKGHWGSEGPEQLCFARPGADYVGRAIFAYSSF